MAKCGLSNFRVAVGPGLRVGVAWRGDALILLLAGGNKSNRAADIAKSRLSKRIRLMIETFIRFDAAEYIRTDEDIASAVISRLAHELCTAGRARGVSQIARAIAE